MGTVPHPVDTILVLWYDVSDQGDGKDWTADAAMEKTEKYRYLSLAIGVIAGNLMRNSNNEETQHKA